MCSVPRVTLNGAFSTVVKIQGTWKDNDKRIQVNQKDGSWPHEPSKVGKGTYKVFHK